MQCTEQQRAAIRFDRQLAERTCELCLGRLQPASAQAAKPSDLPNELPHHMESADLHCRVRTDGPI